MWFIFRGNGKVLVIRVWSVINRVKEGRKRRQVVYQEVLLLPVNSGKENLAPI